MGGIPHLEHEYAVVHRLCSQMPFEDAEFKATETYAAFNTILCWTLQRIRSHEYPFNDLEHQLRSQDITGFCELQPHPYDDGNLGGEDETHGAILDDLSLLRTQDGQPLKVLEVLISLRNAVAHPEDLSVYPINRRGLLIGFRLECRKPGGTGVARWENGRQYQLYLTRHGMTTMARALGEAYCSVFEQRTPGAQERAIEMGEQ
jgi:hypothetical protein